MKVVADTQRHRLLKQPGKDACIWQQVATSLLKGWGDDPRRLLAGSGVSGPVVLERLAVDMHQERGRNVADYPYLRGPNVGPLWLLMLCDNVGIELGDLDAVPIPVDVHVARASFATRVPGSYSGALPEAFDEIRNVWRAAAALVPHPVGRPMMALDVNEPLPAPVEVRLPSWAGLGRLVHEERGVPRRERVCTAPDAGRRQRHRSADVSDLPAALPSGPDLRYQGAWSPN